MIVEKMQNWHEAVCKRDGYICQLQISPDCKKDYSFDIYFDESGRNQFVCGDHLKTQKAFPELRLETSNGKCVCFSCHTLRHKGADLPSGYLEPSIENPIHVSSKNHIKSDDLITLPNGLKIRLKGYEVLCRCGFIANSISKLCMKCEKKGNSFFKKEKKSK